MLGAQYGLWRFSHSVVLQPAVILSAIASEVGVLVRVWRAAGRCWLARSPLLGGTGWEELPSFRSLSDAAPFGKVQVEPAAVEPLQRQ